MAKLHFLSELPILGTASHKTSETNGPAGMKKAVITFRCSWNKEIRKALQGKPNNFLMFLFLNTISTCGGKKLRSLLQGYQSQDLALIYSQKTIYFMFLYLSFSTHRIGFFPFTSPAFSIRPFILHLFSKSIILSMWHWADTFKGRNSASPSWSHWLAADGETQAPQSHYFTCILSVQSPVFYRWKKLAKNYLNKLTVLISKDCIDRQFSLLNMFLMRKDDTLKLVEITRNHKTQYAAKSQNGCHY